MSQVRRVVRSWKSVPTIEGAGVHLKRALGFQGSSPELDPFLLLDDFHSHSPAKYLPGFRGTLTGGSKLSPTFWKERSRTVTAWETRGSSE